MTKWTDKEMTKE